jgi:four helix bundle protein
MERKFDLENRLIAYANAIIRLVEKFPKNYIGKYFGQQLLRSGSSPALNYGEAQAAESKKDFIHKMKICLKELRETSVALQIVSQNIIPDAPATQALKKETGELIAIFTASIKTVESGRK